ncbi:MAG: hypothetical protein ACOYLQ_10950 [Hyphomicrobiaceae bacterium]
MWAFISAVIVVIGIGYGASIALEQYQRTADSAFVGSGAKPSPEGKLHGHGGYAPKS